MSPGSSGSLGQARRLEQCSAGSSTSLSLWSATAGCAQFRRLEQLSRSPLRVLRLPSCKRAWPPSMHRWLRLPLATTSQPNAWPSSMWALLLTNTSWRWPATSLPQRAPPWPLEWLPCTRRRPAASWTWPWRRPASMILSAGFICGAMSSNRASWPSPRCSAPTRRAAGQRPCRQSQAGRRAAWPGRSPASRACRRGSAGSRPAGCGSGQGQDTGQASASPPRGSPCSGPGSSSRRAPRRCCSSQGRSRGRPAGGDRGQSDELSIECCEPPRRERRLAEHLGPGPAWLPACRSPRRT